MDSETQRRVDVDCFFRYMKYAVELRQTAMELRQTATELRWALVDLHQIIVFDRRGEM
jgi:hypothetical protein